MPLILAVTSVAVFFWGATPIATKIAVGGMDPLTAGVVRDVLAASATIPLVLVYRLRLPPAPGHPALLAIAAVGAPVLFPTLFSLGMARTTAGQPQARLCPLLRT